MRQRVVTDTDIDLLRSLDRERSVVAASRKVGISRDRANYRIARLERDVGGPLVESVRGGRDHGRTRLTALGSRIVRDGFDSVELRSPRAVRASGPSNLLQGIYHGLPAPEVCLLGRALRLRVAFEAKEGEPVWVALAQESILIARGRFPSSARNVFPAAVESTRVAAGTSGSFVVAKVGHLKLRIGVTPEAIDQLKLRPGARVWLYVKATALKRAYPVAGRPPAPPTRGSLRS